MFETLLITFREGLEAFLIIAITLAYLNKTGRYNLIKPVYFGIAVALIISATTGYHINALAEDPMMEGALALIAGIMVASLTFFIMKNARHIKKQITDRIDRHAEKSGTMAEIGIFAFTVLMIAREGMETALMLGGIGTYESGLSMLIGAILGLVLVALIGYAWVKQSHKINLKLFMQVTGVFLILFAIQLFIYGLHELGEVGALPVGHDLNYAIHTATEPFGHDSIYAELITYSLLAVPCGWLLFTVVKDKFSPSATIAK